ncbi:hypothetical protein EJ06DRAFT_477430 [Trichodelitschia bisporula]|uniref:Bromodomain associated domain-containing protein n=1 Tax=Trichodelitschia bisporula TaxID=703511 RepID=A0A6G1HW96_9PEZI|nr:hypothetical protein EJ06DRAFT_477430 [Trichodelitschia bisporula]
MSSLDAFHLALLRPAILQILRAAGFHAARPSVIDAVTEMAAKYMMALGERTARYADLTANINTPDVRDARLALTDVGQMIPFTTATEEIFKEMTRVPLDEIRETGERRVREQRRRDDEDTADVRAFAGWFDGPTFKEIGRIARVEGEEERKEDYVTVLKKKHSKTGEDTRFQGTILGPAAEPRPIHIEGGPETIEDWHWRVRQRYSEHPVKSLNGKRKRDEEDVGEDDVRMKECSPSTS